jgi:hypothetical protein
MSIRLHALACIQALADERETGNNAIGTFIDDLEDPLYPEFQRLEGRHTLIEKLNQAWKNTLPSEERFALMEEIARIRARIAPVRTGAQMQMQL